MILHQDDNYETNNDAVKKITIHENWRFYSTAEGLEVKVHYY